VASAKPVGALLARAGVAHHVAQKAHAEQLHADQHQQHA
jgi:hypothetical protein